MEEVKESTKGTERGDIVRYAFDKKHTQICFYDSCNNLYVVYYFLYTIYSYDIIDKLHIAIYQYMCVKV